MPGFYESHRGGTARHIRKSPAEERPAKRTCPHHPRAISCQRSIRKTRATESILACHRQRQSSTVPAGQTASPRRSSHSITQLPLRQLEVVESSPFLAPSSRDCASCERPSRLQRCLPVSSELCLSCWTLVSCASQLSSSLVPSLMMGSALPWTAVFPGKFRSP